VLDHATLTFPVTIVVSGVLELQENNRMVRKARSVIDLMFMFGWFGNESQSKDSCFHQNVALIEENIDKNKRLWQV